MRPVVLEGPDNSGKSTLANKIALVRGSIIVSSEGREKFKGEINERVKRYHDTYSGKNVVFDRHPAVSQGMYAILNPNTPVDYDLAKQFYDMNPLFIYCRPDVEKGMEGHVADKPGDTPEYLSLVSENFKPLTAAYDLWALKKAHIIYRIGDDVDQLINLINGAIPV